MLQCHPLLQLLKGARGVRWGVDAVLGWRGGGVQVREQGADCGRPDARAYQGTTVLLMHEFLKAPSGIL
jgi:hypothetical protein